ncbi:hypothetical protein SAMN04488564_106107 [Lentzea waywayandensis]|uniref:Uncharacterized protein n=2 Tax=Lentzea waywayandensis TaxID=84724 RepID=A0A1I6EX97_9PSEU|nr:hypothetical protein SAMN04488564_106107 [Lentzea waywayandensis]
MNDEDGSVAQPESDVVSSVEECMKLLLRSGFRRTVVRDQFTCVNAVMFRRVWRGTNETVLALSESEALAYRVAEGDADPADPFVVDPDLTMWQCGGEFLDVAGQLLGLPAAPGQSAFDRNSGG